MLCTFGRPTDWNIVNKFDDGYLQKEKIKKKRIAGFYHHHHPWHQNFALISLHTKRFNALHEKNNLQLLLWAKKPMKVGFVGFLLFVEFLPSSHRARFELSMDNCAQGHGTFGVGEFLLPQAGRRHLQRGGGLRGREGKSG